ncbi:hypothetical protein I4U23_008036 [Adineta vaga]|nr:hypothetical protein I4U23_008036 [Adineta vaga]
MSCGKVSDKLWKKYGDFRERLQIIQKDQQCFTQFQLPRIRQKSSNVHNRSSIPLKTSTVKNINRSINQRKCNSLLPIECCRNDHLSFLSNSTDREKLEKLMQAADFPDNIFPINTHIRPSIDDGIEPQKLANRAHTTISEKKNIINHPTIQQNNEPSRLTQLSDEHSAHSLISNSHNPNTNPYKQLLNHLRKMDTIKINHSNSKINDESIKTTLPIQNFLSFLHSLDDKTISSQIDSNILDENILISLFSVDNYLSSSIYIPTNIHQLNPIPKTILNSLNNISDNQQILKKIKDEVSLNKLKGVINNHNQQSYVTNDLHYTDEDNNLNAKLYNTYAIQVFKEFILHRHPSTRLPK